MRTTAALSLCVLPAAATSPYDLRRAAAPHPRPHLTAAPAAVHAALNPSLRRDAAARACADFTPAQLNDAVRGLWAHLSPQLNDVYVRNTDRRALRLPTLAAFEASWAARDAGHPRPDRLRDGKCAEVAMLWTHHTSHATRAALRGAGVTIPLLAPLDAAHAAGDDVYAAQASCAAGHNNNGTTPPCAGTLPCWPEEVQWNGTGFGKYPFWNGAFAQAGPCSKSSGAAITTHWSQTKKSEKLEHANCGLAPAGYKDGVACTHLFVGWSAWVYTPAEDFCCVSGCGYEGCQQEVLTSPQADFYKAFTYNGVSDNYVGSHYSGKIKNYTLGPTNTVVPYFWYFTDLEDRPVEQGEGPGVWPRNLCNRGASYIYHEYASFEAATIDASVFDIPDVCKTTTQSCEFP